MNAPVALAHAELDRLRTLATTEPRRAMGYVQSLPTSRARHLLLLAVTTPEPQPTTIPSTLADLARAVGRDGLDALAGSWLDRAEVDGLQVDHELTAAVDELVDRALTASMKETQHAAA